MNNKKKEVVIKFEDFLNRWDFDGDIDEVSEMIKNIPKRLKEIYPQNNEINLAHRFTIETGTEYEYHRDDSHDTYTINAYRWETDEEYNNRIKKEEKIKEAAKKAAITRKEKAVEREKILLSKLLNKYKDDNI